ncbi:hypothetical protein [Adhaeribacter aquaticus]|uniref:hypothetical protein n=1 Tax=Adhaeribacter aquaticus TaxID=299567 RepID=UPI00040ADE2D|nr:hypothetical protein [Adhaeribacter aquaticus]
MPETPAKKSKSVKARAINLAPKNVAGTTTPRTVEQKNKEQAKVIKWGSNDKLPHEIITLVKESPTLRRCLAKLDNFIQADGFSDPEAAEFMVNDKQTADDLLNQIANDAANFGGAFALRVKYNLDLEPAQAIYVPIQTVRKLDSGQFLVNHTLGTKDYKKEHDQILDPFNPDNEDGIMEMLIEVEAQVNEGKEANQRGQLYFYYRKTGLTPDYPEPEWLAGKEDIETDAQIPKSDNKAVKKNFRPAVIVEVLGDIDDTPDPDTGRSDWDDIEDTIKELTDPENECEAVVINTPTTEGGTKLHSFDSKATLTAMDPKRQTIAEAVCRHAGIHSALVFKTPGQLGQSQEVLNLIQMQQAEVNPIQRQITRAFTRIFPKTEGGAEIDWTISTYSPIKAIPPEMWEVMTAEEKRNYAGLPELAAPQSTEAEKTLQALNGLSPLVANKVLESMSDEEIRALIGLKGSKPQTTTTNEDNQG